MSVYLATINDKLRLTKCGGVLVEAKSQEEPCCCPKKICWARARGTLFAAGSDDISITASSDLNQCKVVVDYFPVQCGAYPYFSASKITEFLSQGGVYITNCEWTNCQASGGCDPDGAAFAAHMAAIGCSLARGRGTISTNPNYTPSGAKIFAGCTINGDATAEMTGGTPLSTASPGRFCPAGFETGGTQGAGAKTNKGAVIAFGDSNMYIGGPLRENLLNTPVDELF
jgi:hypothetical protein